MLSFLSGSKVNKRVRLRTGLFRISDQMWSIIRRKNNKLPETFWDPVTSFGFLWNSNCKLSTMSSHRMRFAYIIWKRYSIVISDPRKSVRNVKNSKFWSDMVMNIFRHTLIGRNSFCRNGCSLPNLIFYWNLGIENWSRPSTRIRWILPLTRN